LNANISGETDQLCLGQNGFFWQPHVKVFRREFKASGVGGGGASAPPKFLIWWKSFKICVNLGKMCENLREIALYALILQKWHPKWKRRRFFLLEVMIFSVFSSKFEKIWAKMVL